MFSYEGPAFFLQHFIMVTAPWYYVWTGRFEHELKGWGWISDDPSTAHNVPPLEGFLSISFPSLVSFLIAGRESESNSYLACRDFFLFALARDVDLGSPSFHLPSPTFSFVFGFSDITLNISFSPILHSHYSHEEDLFHLRRGLLRHALPSCRYHPHVFTSSPKFTSCRCIWCVVARDRHSCRSSLLVLSRWIASFAR